MYNSCISICILLSVNLQVVWS